MKKWFFLVALAIAVSSCKFYEPEFRGGEKFDLVEKDGQKVAFTAGAKVYNGNWFGVKIKPSYLDMYVDGKYFGKVHLEKKVKMKAKKETMLEAPFVAELEDGALVRLLTLSMKDKVSVNLKGKVKGGVFIFSKKIDFDETFSVNPKNLK